ncbi:tellurium resistance protein TerZ [Nocardioides sp. BE266]|uniref:TerD family protein n=1 Tax=Nocardioides sp. BE266 TaxID=2817725 RepID=UPI00285A4205|nr:TerD family protein [Nocardioides sp. BE266]MDR7251583.1 tellurium resistance protein TerZ [Nocardioides sp. BE266]
MIELTEGQELTLTGVDGTPLTRVRMALGWDHNPTAGFIASGAPPIDLDASAVQFAGGQFFDLAFFNHLATRDGSVVHLGDNITGKGEGDDEVITVDLSRVYAKVETILFLVSSYQGHSLEYIHNAYCRLVDDDDTELARVTITLGVRETGLVMAKLSRDGSGWKLGAIGTGIALKTPTDSLEALLPFV